MVGAFSMSVSADVSRGGDFWCVEDRLLAAVLHARLATDLTGRCATTADADARCRGKRVCNMFFLHKRVHCTRSHVQYTRLPGAPKAWLPLETSQLLLVSTVVYTRLVRTY